MAESRHCRTVCIKIAELSGSNPPIASYARILRADRKPDAGISP
jgi:hypothetical protein